MSICAHVCVSIRVLLNMNLRRWVEKSHFPYELLNNYFKISLNSPHLISMARILLCSFAVRVHDSQAYRKMDVTMECISRILELREILLSIQTGFSLVNAAVVYAILESISGLEPSSVITEPRYLKLVTVSSFCPFTLISVLMPLVLSSAWSSRH